MAAEYDASPREIRQFVVVQLLLTAGFVAVLGWVHGGLDADLPPIWLWVVLLVPVPVAAFFAERVWLATEPLPADVDRPHAQALDVFAAQTVRKLIICEIPVILGVLIGFVAGHGGWPALIAGVPALAVLAFESWPSARNLSLTETVLASDGAPTRLLEDFGA